MTGRKQRSVLVYSVLTTIWGLCLSLQASAQGGFQRGRANETIDAGTQVTVRTTEPINTSNGDGREFLGTIEQDVVSRNGTVVIPRGSDASLIVRRISNDELTVDLDSVTVNGETYGIVSEATTVDADRRQGIGANQRTGEYVGGGAVIGAIIGAIVGGGKGAAIGAGAGAAAGAGTQVLTRGRSVAVPSESLLTFNLQQPLRIGTGEDLFSRDGHWYREGYGVSPGSAYLQGLRDGRSDADRNREDNWRPNQWPNEQARRDYTAGYTRGYQERASSYNGSQTYGLDTPRANIRIGRDNNVSWKAPNNVRLFVQVDNRAPRLFAEGTSGIQAAPWISPGHVYVFVMRDVRGNEVTREQLDLRRRSNWR
jgi:hypothetical protein